MPIVQCQKLEEGRLLRPQPTNGTLLEAATLAPSKGGLRGAGVLPLRRLLAQFDPRRLPSLLSPHLHTSHAAGTSPTLVRGRGGEGGGAGSLQLLEVTPRYLRQVFPKSPHLITALTVLAKLQFSSLRSRSSQSVLKPGDYLTTSRPLTHRNTSATPSPARRHRYGMGRTSSAQRRGHKRDGRMAGFDPIRGSTMQRNLLPSQPRWNHAHSAVSVFGGHFQHNLPAHFSWIASVTSPFTGCMSFSTSLALSPSVIRLASIPDPCRQPDRPPRCKRRGNRRLLSTFMTTTAHKRRSSFSKKSGALSPFQPVRSFTQLLLK